MNYVSKNALVLLCLFYLTPTTLAVVINKDASQLRIEQATAKAVSLINGQQYRQASVVIADLLDANNLSEQSAVSIVNAYLKQNRVGDAHRICQFGLMRYIRSPRLLTLMGNIYDRRGLSDTALIYYTRVPTDGSSVPDRASALRELIAHDYLRLMDFEGAQDALKGSNSDIYDSQVHTVAKAKYFASIGELDNAVKTLDRSLETKASTPLILTKSQLLLLDGQFHETINVIEKIENQLTGAQLSAALMIKSTAYLQLDSNEQAMDTFQRSKSLNPGSNIHSLSESILYMSLGNIDEATKSLRKAPMPFPELAGYTSLRDHMKPSRLAKAISLSYFSLDQGFYNITIKTTLAALKTNKNNVFLRFLLAESHRRQHDYAAAVAELKTLITTMPESFFFRYQLATTYEQMGREEDALALFKALSEERPDFIMAQLSHGKLLATLGRWEEAKSTYSWSLNFQPEVAPLLISYGFALIEVNDHASLATIVETLESNNRVPHSLVLHLKGWSAYTRNNTTEAEQLLLQALTLNPGSPEIYYHLAVVLLKNGKKSQAQNLFTQVLFYPEQRKKYQQKIDSLLAASTL